MSIAMRCAQLSWGIARPPTCSGARRAEKMLHRENQYIRTWGFRVVESRVFFEVAQLMEAALTDQRGSAHRIEPRA